MFAHCRTLSSSSFQSLFLLVQLLTPPLAVTSSSPRSGHLWILKYWSAYFICLCPDLTVRVSFLVCDVCVFVCDTLCLRPVNRIVCGFSVCWRRFYRCDAWHEPRNGMDALVAGDARAGSRLSYSPPTLHHYRQVPLLWMCNLSV